jgi:hypothetical protein
MSENLKDRVIEIVQLVAAEAPTQIASFPDYVEVPDEIAIEVGELAALLEEASRSALDEISDDERGIVKELDSLFSRFSGADHLDVWTLAAMETHSVWLDTRELAERWLAAKGIPRRAPNLFWLIFVGPER